MSEFLPMYTKSCASSIQPFWLPFWADCQKGRAQNWQIEASPMASQNGLAMHLCFSQEPMTEIRYIAGQANVRESMSISDWGFLRDQLQRHV